MRAEKSVGKASAFQEEHRDVRVITPNGELLRHLTLDPARDYQPQTLGWTSTMS